MADEELTENQQMVLSLRKTNMEILRRLNAANVSVNGISNERHEFFVRFLVEIGVVSQELFEQFEVQWESYLNDVLQKREVEVQRAMTEGKMQRPPGYGGLIIPGRG